MILIDEIREHFASGLTGFRPITSISVDNQCFTFQTKYDYGVAIINNNDIEINESFSNVHILSTTEILDNKLYYFIVLKSSIFTLQNEFAAICTQFLELGDNCTNRISIQSNPSSWWQKWKNLLGNAIIDRKPYSVVAEMMAYHRILQVFGECIWGGPNSGSHDLEAENFHAEVKSSLGKYVNEIQISGQFQLKHDKPLNILFYKMESSGEGLSINDMIDSLEEVGADRHEVESKLVILGYHKGMSAREEKFKVNEARRYKVDQNFPIITPASFVGNTLPKGIKRFTYVIELDGLEYESWS